MRLFFLVGGSRNLTSFLHKLRFLPSKYLDTFLLFVSKRKWYLFHISTLSFIWRTEFSKLCWISTFFLMIWRFFWREYVFTLTISVLLQTSNKSFIDPLHVVMLMMFAWEESGVVNKWRHANFDIFTPIRHAFLQSSLNHWLPLSRSRRHLWTTP